MTFKELLDGIETGDYQLRVRCTFDLEDYCFQFTPIENKNRPSWQLTDRGSELIQKYVSIHGIDSCDIPHNYKDSIYRPVDEMNLQWLNKHHPEFIYKSSVPIYSANPYVYFTGVASLSISGVKDLVEFAIRSFNDAVQYPENHRNLYYHGKTLDPYSEIPDEFYSEFPQYLWEECMSICPSDFFKMDLKDHDIDEILEIHEDLIDYKPVIGINTGATFEHFELGIYKLK